MKNWAVYSSILLGALTLSSCSKEVNESLGSGNVGSTGINTIQSSCVISPSSVASFTTTSTHTFTVTCQESKSDGSSENLIPRCYHNNLLTNCVNNTITVSGDGSHSVKVNAVDSQGRTVPDAGPINFTIDREGPVIRSGSAGELGTLQRLISIDLSSTDLPAVIPANPNDPWISSGVGVDENKYYCAISTSSGNSFFNDDFMPTNQSGGPLSTVSVSGNDYFLCSDGAVIRVPDGEGQGPFYLVAMGHDLLNNRGPQIEFPSGGGVVLSDPPVQSPMISVDSFTDSSGSILSHNAPTINNDSNVTGIRIAGIGDFPLSLDIDCDDNCGGITEWRCSSVAFPSDAPLSGWVCPGSTAGSSLSTIIESHQITESCNHTLYVRAVSGNTVSNTIRVKYNADKTIPFVDSIEDVDEDQSGTLDIAEMKKETVFQLYKTQTCASGTGTCLLDKLYYGANDYGCKAGLQMKCMIMDPNTNESFGPYNCTEEASSNCPDGDSHCSEFDRVIGDILTGGDALNPSDRGSKNNLVFEFEACDGAANCIRSSTPVNNAIAKDDPCPGQPNDFGCRSSLDNTGGVGNGTAIDPYDPYGPGYPNFPF